MADEIRYDIVSVAHNRGLTDAARGMKEARGEADKMGASFGRAGDEAFDLDKAVEEAREEVKKLREEFKQTGDTTLFGDMRAKRSELKALLAVAADEAEDAGKKAARSFSSGMGHTRLGPALIGGLVVGLAPFLPMVGAMVAGAVVGTGGLLGITGGILAASKDPGVRAAASQFGKNISSAFFQSGESLVEPLKGAFAILEQGFNDLNLGETFKLLSGYVDDLAMGIAGFGREFMSRFNESLKVAGPLIELLGRELPKVGAALGYMFQRMAEGKGTMQGGLILLGFLEANLKGIGNILGWLSDRFYDFNTVMAGVTGFLEDVGNVFGGVHDDIEKFQDKANVGRQVADDISQNFQNLAGSAQRTADAIRAVNQALFDFHNSSLTADEAADRFKSDLLALKKSVQEHGTSLASNTEAGLANRAMLRGLVGDALAVRDANVEAGMEVDEANALYQAQVKQLQTLAEKLGFTRDEVALLIGEYKRIPPRITTQIITQYQQEGKPAGEHSGLRITETDPGLRRRQFGGPVGPGAWLVGEKQPEVLEVGAGMNGHVYPSMSSYNGSRGSGGAGARPVVISASAAGDALFNWLVKEIARRGGTLAAIGIKG